MSADASAPAPVRPKVFFDMTIGGHEAGRIVFELFSDVVCVCQHFGRRPASARADLERPHPLFSQPEDRTSSFAPARQLSH
jgi:hypothetical protein